MRCFLAGSKALSVAVLDILIDEGHDVIGVMSRDHEKNMQTWMNELGHPSLKERAQKLNIPVYEKVSLNSSEMLYKLSEMNLDIIFSTFWGEIIKSPVLLLPKLGCINLHSAYLPLNQGSFPMAWAIINGEPFAGVTIHRMSNGVDDGHIISQIKVPIDENETGKSIYKKVTAAGEKLFKESLPKIAKNNFILKPQQSDISTYNPRGIPYGGQTNPYWAEKKKKRFKNALTFPPFENLLEDVPALLKGYTEPKARIMIGFDCDRPRGIYAFSKEGKSKGNIKIKSLEAIRETLNQLNIPRTYFICGNFLESMNCLYGKERLKNAFEPSNSLVEIGDHTYTHDIVKKIPTRPDKIPMKSNEIVKQYAQNSLLFRDTFGEGFNVRGYRTPLGHFNGLDKAYKLTDTLKRLNIPYVSSDLRDKNSSLNPKLIDAEGKIRQPYRYKNGLLEIPSIGWQDTAFSRKSSTKLFEKPPKNYNEILLYFELLFSKANDLAKLYSRDIFIGLVAHPFDVTFYDEKGNFFKDIYVIAKNLKCTFHSYKEVANHYDTPKIHNYN